MTIYKPVTLGKVKKYRQEINRGSIRCWECGKSVTKHEKHEREIVL